MASEFGAPSGFAVEEFITAITTQLDRVQDALRLKSVNRPLTYALKDLHLELKVFVDMGPDGGVRLRSAAPNEAGASTMTLDFTTVTRAMVEENTISLAAARSAPLDTLGLNPEEQRSLERIGVTNLAQLNKLNQSAGSSALARYAALPPDRMRSVLDNARGRITGGGPRPALPPVPPPLRNPPPRPTPLPPRSPVRPPPVARAPLQPAGRRRRPDEPFGFAAASDDTTAIRVSAGARAVELHGRNLLAGESLPSVRLDGRELAIEAADHDRLSVALPADAADGEIEIRFEDGDTVVLPLIVEAAEADDWTPAPSYGEGE